MLTRLALPRRDVKGQHLTASQNIHRFAHSLQLKTNAQTPETWSLTLGRTARLQPPSAQARAFAVRALDRSLPRNAATESAPGTTERLCWTDRTKTGCWCRPSNRTLLLQTGQGLQPLSREQKTCSPTRIAPAPAEGGVTSCSGHFREKQRKEHRGAHQWRCTSCRASPRSRRSSRKLRAYAAARSVSFLSLCYCGMLHTKQVHCSTLRALLASKRPLHVSELLNTR